MIDYQYSETLLPPNPTALDRHLEQVIRHRFDSLPVEILRQFWQPENCPAHLLPHLARQYSVDIWRDEWSESRKRAVVAASPQLHRIKGTRAAIELALESLGQVFDLTEWWEEGADKITGYTPGYCTAWLAIDGDQWEASAVSISDIMQALGMCKRMTLHIHIWLKLALRGQDTHETLAVMPMMTGGNPMMQLTGRSHTLMAAFLMIKEAA